MQLRLYFFVLTLTGMLVFPSMATPRNSDDYSSVASGSGSSVIALQPPSQGTSYSTLGLREGMSQSKFQDMTCTQVLPAYNEILVYLNNPQSPDFAALQRIQQTLNLYFSEFFTLRHQMPSFNREMLEEAPCRCEKRSWPCLNYFWAKEAVMHLACGGIGDGECCACNSCFEKATMSTFGVWPVVMAVIGGAVLAVEGTVRLLTLPCQFQGTCPVYKDEVTTSAGQWRMLAATLYAILNTLGQHGFEDGTMLLGQGEILQQPPA